MEGFQSFLTLVYLISIYVFFKFVWGSEGKDERGERIMGKTAIGAFSVFPVGWILIDSYHEYIQPISYSLYRELISMLIPITFLICAILIVYNRRKT
ncbi:hypothetical protein [Piscibacillus halophilus]|uniref:hypothetical protein n=1 Tax=Piscibacillus halophilus TaxID=571933 RepID=UPI00158D4F27|nr:hypothetical protein [Piscibacillus halophilus]